MDDMDGLFLVTPKASVSPPGVVSDPAGVSLDDLFAPTVAPMVPASSPSLRAPPTTPRVEGKFRTRAGSVPRTAQGEHDDSPVGLMRQLVADGDWKDAALVIEWQRVVRLERLAHSHLAAARLEDDRLEEAITHRNDMRRWRIEGYERHALLTFLTTFRHIRWSSVLVNELNESEALRRKCRHAMELNSLSVAHMESLAIDLLEAADAQDEAMRLLMCKSVPMRLLYAALTDAARGAMQLACATVVESIADYKAPTSPRRWKSILTGNVHCLRQTEEGVAHLEGVRQLAIVAQSMVGQASEDLKASLAPLVGELQALWDACGHPLPPKAGPRSRTCSLSGLPFDGHDDVHPFVKAYVARL